jgi:hypothetical protein
LLGFGGSKEIFNFSGVNGGKVLFGVQSWSLLGEVGSELWLIEISDASLVSSVAKFSVSKGFSTIGSFSSELVNSRLMADSLSQGKSFTRSTSSGSACSAFSPHNLSHNSWRVGM